MGLLGAELKQRAVFHPDAWQSSAKALPPDSSYCFSHCHRPFENRLSQNDGINIGIQQSPTGSKEFPTKHTFTGELEVRIRVPDFFSVLYVSRGTLPTKKETVRKGTIGDLGDDSPRRYRSQASPGIAARGYVAFSDVLQGPFGITLGVFLPCPF